MFSDLLERISELADQDFHIAASELTEYIDADQDFFDIIQQIGAIPEAIAHDSTEEKLYAKASDAVLSRAFREIGLRSTVLQERADSADVIARSELHGYTLVADAKAFRMSRTAKNQKDYKVVALSGWRKDADYAVLCAPLFQYPIKNSQIYAQALEHNVCLLGWEHLIFLLEHGIRESESVNLATLWNFCDTLSETTMVSEMKNCFLRRFHITMLSLTDKTIEDFQGSLFRQIETLKARGKQEKDYWIHQMSVIKAYTREQAIQELLSSKKIYEKITQINTYVRGLKPC